ncbi:MAG: hypothetical protein QOI63_842, partial [Thermoplasmata archaeon]|nr:hypothetical protein [Thermoplasmata archaeon]
MPLLLIAALALAGCASKPMEASTGTGTHADGSQAARGWWAYTTPDPGGPRFSKDYAGTLTAQEASGLEGGVPLGISPPTFNTCCYLDWVDAPDLLANDQLVALRITLNWTNSDTDHAGLDAAACVPWRCQTFNRGPDESQVNGPHSDVLTLVTSGRQDFLDQGGVVQLGARYTNAVLANGLAYTLHVEAAPVGNGLALQDPYLVHVEPNATVQAQLVGPYSPDGIEAGLMVYGPDDRPARWIDLA